MIQLAPDGALEELMAQNPVVSLLLSEDARHTLMMVSPEGDSLSVARRVDDVIAPAGASLTFSGNPVVFASVIDLLSWFLLIIPPVVIVLLVGTFFATIGDRRLSVMALIPAALGAIWTFGLIFGLGREIDIVTVIVPIFVIVMGYADGLHFVTHFQEEAENPDPVARVSSALSHVGVPMILTTISTAAGFLSLVATNVHPIQQLGLFTAIGITFAGVISFFSRMVSAMSRYAARSTWAFSRTLGRSCRPLEGSSVIRWAADRLWACCAKRSMPKTSARIGSSHWRAPALTGSPAIT
jgi:predicted RND superfamily exporter protein